MNKPKVNLIHAPVEKNERVESVQVNYKNGESVVIPVVDTAVIFTAVHATELRCSDFGDCYTHHHIAMRWVTDDDGDAHREAADSDVVN